MDESFPSRSLKDISFFLTPPQTNEDYFFLFPKKSTTSIIKHQQTKTPNITKLKSTIKL